MRLLDPTYPRRALSLNDIAGKRDVGCGLIGYTGKFGIALRAMNISNEQQTAGMGSI
jgi:hypothetical protein